MLKVTVFLLLIAPAFAQKKPITLESMSLAGRGGGRAGAGGPGAGTWAPDGRSFVFRQGRSLMIYDPAARSAKELVSTEAMDAAAMNPPAEDGPVDWTNRRARTGGLAWSADGKALLYTAGGDVFLIHVDTGKWDQITKTPVPEIDPKLSPDGKTIVFRRGWDIYTSDVATHKETRLTNNGTETLRNGGTDWVYPEEIGLGTAFWWSPDSKSVAYLQFDMSREPLVPHEDLLRVRAVYEPERFPQAGEHNPDIHLGVVSATGGPTRWLDVGDTRESYLVARVGWMPNARSVYVLRTNRVQNRDELLSIDVESGSPSTIFKESDPYWINLQGDVEFLKDGKRLLWTSERDGYRHIYLYSNDGKDVKQVTKGGWEVTAINGVDEAAGRLFYTSTEPSSLERHLYSIGLNGQDKRALTPEPGTHGISMGSTGAYYLDTFSSLASPPRTTLHSGDGKELGVYREADRTDMDQYEILPTEIVKFKGPDGTELYGRMIKPAGFQPGKKYPVVVSVYGGPGVGLPVRNSWQGISLDQVLAHKGYVIWQAENRGGMGRGHTFETAIYHKLGVAELADQVAGVKHLISLGFVDPARIGIHGWSYGGFMTVNALLNAPEVFHAGFAGAPVTSWMNYDTIYTERYMGLPKDNPDGYRDTALPQAAKNLKGKLMLVHNFEDDNVLFQNSLQMTNALQLAGKQFEYMLYPQKAHGVSGAASRQMNEMMVVFFDRALK
ncbi:MAG: S9 family peptidase [Acidobacteriia bacterium]|nr:S9 family peptidase [Terriglobia bacterium]